MTVFEIESAQAIRPHTAPSGIVAVGTAQITSLEPPRFDDPVSQFRTPAQTREAAFARWRILLDCWPDDWSAAFVLQVLDRYGLLVPGARGCHFGDDVRNLSRAFAASGAGVGPGSDCDFAWSVRGDLARGDLLPLARDMVGALRPGGVGVLVFPFGQDAIERTDVERAAIDLIADAHAVAALKFRGHHIWGTVPFGFVFGRGAA